MKFIGRRLSIYWQYAIYKWHTFIAINRARARYKELERLICWSKRKNLSGPNRLYKSRLIEEEFRLMRYQARHRYLVNICEWLEIFMVQIKPSIRQYRRGSAAKYLFF
jgi:hypothetical protein